MDKYINQQTLQNALERKQCGPANKRYTEGWNDCLMRVKSMVSAAPIIDAVPVVRCKDCKHSTLPSELTQRYGKPGTLTCHNRHSPCNRRNVGENDFCSYGEPKEG